MPQPLPTLTEFMDYVKTIDDKGSELTSWEINFIASFIDHPPSSFTEKQWDIVQRIYREKVK